MTLFKQIKTDSETEFCIQHNLCNLSGGVTAPRISGAVIVALGCLLANPPSTVFAQMDNLDAAKEEALSHSDVPAPIATPSSSSLKKIESTSFSLSDLKSKTRLVTPGWLRTYATVALPPDMLLALPEYYESALEADMRATIQQSLVAREIATIEDPEQSAYRLTYSVEVREPEKSSLGQSRLRLEPDVIDNENSWSPRSARPADGVRPGISLGPIPEYEPRGPVLRASIIVLNGDERVWSGFAEAELGDHLRSELTGVLVRALMRHWGQNAAMDGGHFSQSPNVGLSLNSEGDGQP